MNGKYIITFSLGAVTGAVATYFYVRNKFEEEYQQSRQELVDLYINKSYNNKKEKEDDTESFSTQDAVNRLNSLASSNENSEERYINYTSIYGGDDIGDDTYILENNVEQQLSMAENPTEEVKPYIIDDDQFSDPTPAYDKVTLEYFINNDVLIDSLSHEVMFVSDTIGESNLKYLSSNEDDKDYIYVRNESKAIDYEVVLNYDDYEESEKGYHGIY